MKGHLGAVLTTSLTGLALLLLILQAAVLMHTVSRAGVAAAAPAVRSNRYSMPGGRAGIPWQWLEEPRALPDTRDRAPQSKPPGERQRRNPTRRSFTPEQGPRPARRAAA